MYNDKEWNASMAMQPTPRMLQRLKAPAFRISLARSGQEQGLPDRVRMAIRLQEDATERLIGWVQLAVVITFATLYTVSPKTSPADAFQPVPWVIGTYLLFTVFRLMLAYRTSLPDWFLLLSIVIDMFLLFGLIWSFHIQYDQPASFYLKVPTLLYVFIFVSLRALRFEARFVFAAGLAAAAGWALLVVYAVSVDPQDTMITRDYVEYMTSNSVLVGAEFDKIVSILLVTAILGVALIRGRNLLVRSVAESLAAKELSRFFAPEIAEKIRASGKQITAGSGDARDAAILTLDMRGFTQLAAEEKPDRVMGVLHEYQSLFVPIIQKHGGSIDKFLGDGILATFGAAIPSETYAADALRAADEAIGEARRWREACAAAGHRCPEVNGAVATGRIVFGVVGDDTRLEYTVIGDAVNLAAKLEKHNRDAGVRALTTQKAFDLALRQGYQPATDTRQLHNVHVAGVSDPLDLVVLAP